jgi:hypothetical protein
VLVICAHLWILLQAHPDVMNVLLQLLDDGRVTDSQVCLHVTNPLSVCGNTISCQQSGTARGNSRSGISASVTKSPLRCTSREWVLAAPVPIQEMTNVSGGHLTI